ncbi:hypothetical protein PPERSA_01677 [Pseudocohnilembus persalinus]|uniref:Uncharacterized protein n=1 Tax=Pseudocohnilembus persalinus TaxID=266149 RepID=A0A0V0R0S0_PSEPJ|nr:hypothetical protein PPERSA_01677 [Pseudocohnilembus persalinus]|eukprot:KRX08132.1 hypothetical protein PPERSA_01677 [Pseudocohnilembus persalinus]
MKICQFINDQQLSQLQMDLIKAEKNRKYNNKIMIFLLGSSQFQKIFNFFLYNVAENYLKNSLVQDKENFLKVLKYYQNESSEMLGYQKQHFLLSDFDEKVSEISANESIKFPYNFSNIDSNTLNKQHCINNNDGNQKKKLTQLQQIMQDQLGINNQQDQNKEKIKYNTNTNILFDMYQQEESVNNLQQQDKISDIQEISQQVLAEQKELIDTETEFFIRDKDNLDDFLYEVESSHLRKESSNNFDQLDIVFLSGDTNIRPWQSKSNQWIPKAQCGIHYRRSAEEFQSVGKYILKAPVHKANIGHKEKYQVYRSRTYEDYCQIKKIHLHHWVFEGMQTEFLVPLMNTWDPHTFTFTNQNKKFTVLAESQRGALVIELQNILGVQFEPNGKYPQTLFPIKNFINKTLKNIKSQSNVIRSISSNNNGSQGSTLTEILYKQKSQSKRKALELLSQRSQKMGFGQVKNRKNNQNENDNLSEAIGLQYNDKFKHVGYSAKKEHQPQVTSSNLVSDAKYMLSGQKIYDKEEMNLQSSDRDGNGEDLQMYKQKQNIQNKKSVKFLSRNQSSWQQQQQQQQKQVPGQMSQSTTNNSNKIKALKTLTEQSIPSYMQSTLGFKKSSFSSSLKSFNFVNPQTRKGRDFGQFTTVFDGPYKSQDEIDKERQKENDKKAIGGPFRISNTLKKNNNFFQNEQKMLMHTNINNYDYRENSEPKFGRWKLAI